MSSQSNQSEADQAKGDPFARQIDAFMGLYRSRLRFWRKQWWHWTPENLWQPKDTEWMEGEIFRFADSRNNTNCLMAIQRMHPGLKAYLALSNGIDMPFWISNDQEGIDPSVQHARWVVGDDCIIDPLTGETKRLSPAFFTSMRMPYSLDASLKSQPITQWTAFLNRTFSGDQSLINLIQEWFGYCLLPGNKHHLVLFLEGSGANGKSVLMTVLKQLLGPNNCSMVSLDRFGKKFQLWETHGKLLNVCMDVGEMGVASESVFKGFSGGDSIQVDRKYLGGVSFVPTAKLMFSYNTRPRWIDRTNALWRRFIILEFPNTITRNEQISAFGDPTSPQWPFREELSGIFWWAVEGLKRVAEQDDLEIPERCIVAKEEYRLESNPAQKFLRDFVIFTSEAVLLKISLYTAYRSFCLEHGYKPLAANRFSGAVRSLAKSKEAPLSTNQRTDGRRSWVGLKLKSADSSRRITLDRTRMNVTRADHCRNNGARS